MWLGIPYGPPWHHGDVIRLRSVAFVAAAWILGAATSVGVGLLALTLVGEDLRGDASRPLTADASVVAGTASTIAPTIVASPTGPTPSTTATIPTGETRRLSSPGGDVLARCSAAGVYLVYWSPAQGFRTDDVNRGPAPVATLSFERATVETKLKITCVGGVPQLEILGQQRDDD